MVHALLSLHVAVLLVCTQAHVVVLNESVVQGLLSSHALAWHVPPQHEEPDAQETGVCVHDEPTHAATSHTSDGMQLALEQVGY